METKQLACCMRRKPYTPPRCEELGTYVSPLLAVMSVPYDTTNQWNGEFDARATSDFEEEDDDGWDY